MPPEEETVPPEVERGAGGEEPDSEPIEDPVESPDIPVEFLLSRNRFHLHRRLRLRSGPVSGAAEQTDI